MDALNATVEHIKIHDCPKKAPCPHCGKKGVRKDVHERSVRTIAYQRIVWLDITYGEYRAKCDCCKTFRNCPEGILPRCTYDNKIRDAVIDRILDDGMNVQRVLEAMRRDFFLDLSEGFIYDCLHGQVQQLNMADYRQWVREHFSGTLCIDELHLGRYTLLLATDPLGDFPVAFALVDSNDGAHMRRFLNNLKQGGLLPEVIITDGSPLYPKLLAELWPNARHQLCVFHVLQDLNKLILDALKRFRRKMSRQGNKGRRRKRGRPSKAQQQRRKKANKTAKDKAHFIFKNRYLIVTRRHNLTPEGRRRLRTMFEYLPELRTLYDFADRVVHLFDLEQSEHQARCRRAALLKDAAFQKVPELVKAMDMLIPEKFAKMIAFVHSPAAKKLRTNNHVERCNRKLRYCEKVRYKWRRRRNIIRFLLLSIDRWWHARRRLHAAPLAVPPHKPASSKPAAKQKTSTIPRAA